jgi:hypothetical protein
MKNTFESFDKEEIMKKFKELKAKGKPFTLGDTLRDEDGNLPKIRICESSSIGLENVNETSIGLENVNETSIGLENVNDVSFLQPYYDKVKQLRVSEITTVKTSIGEFIGFFVKDKNIIFYHPNSLAVLLEKNGNDISEISVDEVEELFN